MIWRSRYRLAMLLRALADRVDPVRPLDDFIYYGIVNSAFELPKDAGWTGPIEVDSNTIAAEWVGEPQGSHVWMDNAGRWHTK